MTPSEWMRSVRAVRNTPVADYCAPGVNSTRPVPYRPLIAVSPFLLVLLVSYFNRSLWRCGQLLRYIGMGSLGTRLHRDCNVMGDTAKISPRVPSTCAQNAILSLLIIRDCKAMGDAAKTSPPVTSTSGKNAILSLLIIRDCKVMGNAAKISSRIPFTCAQNAILSLLIIHIIPSHQIYVAIDNPSFVSSVSCLTTSSYLWNDVHVADNISHAENLQSNGCLCFLHLYKFRDRIQVTWVSGIVVSARANQYSTKAPSSFRSLILNSRCSCHGRRPFSAPWHLHRRCFSHTQSFRQSPPRQLSLPVHQHIWDMRWPSKPSTWTLIPW